jgi:predicted RNase H-like HicB family nuclease
VLVSFPNFPGANTFGDDEADALRRGADALVTLLAGMIDDREAIRDLRHASRLDQLERAFLAIGKRLKISLEDAA